MLLLVSLVASTDGFAPRLRTGESVRGSAQPLQWALQRTRPIVRVGGWIFSYADVRPFDETTAEAQLFLATNIAFLIAGAEFSSVGDAPGIGLLCDLAATASVGYHYAQVRLGGTQRPTVQLAMLVDYLTALPTIAIGANYALQLGDAMPVSALELGAAAFLCLGSGWCVEGPRVYMLVHGLWHIFGALAGRELALSHAALAIMQ